MTRMLCVHMNCGKKKQCVTKLKDGSYWLQLGVQVGHFLAKIPGSAPEISFQVNYASKRLRLTKWAVTMVTECFITISTISELCKIYSVARR